MAITKMKMVNIVGPVEEFDRVAVKYISESNIHLENVFMVLDNVKGMYAYNEDSRISEILNQAEELIHLAKIEEDSILKTEKYTEYKTQAPVDLICLHNGLNTVKTSIIHLKEERERMYKKLEEYDELRKQLIPIKSADINLNRLYEFEFIKFRFGKMPVKSYRILSEYLKDMNAFFLKTSEDEEYVWGVYFMPDEEEELIDAIFSSLYFERVRISDNVHGTPEQSLNYLDEREQYRRERISAIDSEIKELVSGKSEFIVYIKSYMKELLRIQDIKKYSGHTKESFYTVGWMAEKDADKLEKKMKDETNIVYLKEEPENVSRVNPPTKLKNILPFKPFELFIEMYGLPSYNEFDPTWIFALSYFLIFGAMFGDLGQGFLLFAGGFILAKLKKSRLAAIIGTVGISSMVFGIIYGSIFGNEELISGFHPMEHIMDILFYSVYFGIGIILFVIVLNIILGIKNKDIKRTVFSQNGLAGLIFYLIVAFTVLSMLKSGGSISSTAVIIVIVAVIFIMLQEPLSKLFQRKKEWLPKKKGMFLMEAFFEMFEIVLSFITNTLSFLRIGAFALIHVGMMGVVNILSNMIGKGTDNIVVLIVGNIFVMCLEGMLVAIQTLRLEYYEMFNRFYTGDGKQFVSLNENIN